MAGACALAASAPAWSQVEPVNERDSTRRIAESILQPRTVLGTRFFGHLFVDGLPIDLDGAQIGHAVELRRARIGFERALKFRWELRGSAELVSGSVELKDLYVRRRFSGLGTLTIGNQSEPFGLDELTSSLALPFLEPSLPTALVPGRNFGVVAGDRRGNIQYQVGVFGSGTEQEGRRDLGAAATGRITHRTVSEGGDVRHIGLALSARQLDGRAEQFRSLPEIGIDQQSLVDTGSIDEARDTLRAGFEYLEVFDRTWVQAEVMRTRVRRTDATDLGFGGAYVEVGWMAWGRRPAYDDGDATLARTPVGTTARWGDARGRGNLGLSARLSRIDLDDADIVGGTETNLSLGATWDISPRSRIAANLVRVVELTGPNAAADDSTALAVRFQYAW